MRTFIYNKIRGDDYVRHRLHKCGMHVNRKFKSIVVRRHCLFLYDEEKTFLGYMLYNGGLDCIQEQGRRNNCRKRICSHSEKGLALQCRMYQVPHKGHSHKFLQRNISRGCRGKRHHAHKGLQWLA